MVTTFSTVGMAILTINKPSVTIKIRNHRNLQTCRTKINQIHITFFDAAC